MKPRTIDIDIVFFDNEKINTSKLKIPHYDWQNRDFFIKPLKEINCQAEEFKILDLPKTFKIKLFDENIFSNRETKEKLYYS